MSSSYSASCRFVLQATGEGSNTWGTILNSGALALIDSAIAGWVTIPLTADLTLTAVNGAADQSRSAMLKFTGTGAFTVTTAAVSKRYDIWNALSGVLTVSNGSASVTLQPGEKVAVITDGGANIARVQPTDFGSQKITSVADPTNAQDAATKAYVDAQAFAAGGTLPGQTGNAGKYLQTNGTAASWAYAVNTGSGLVSVSNATATVTAAAASDVRTGSNTTKAVTAGALMSSSAFQTLTDAATIAWNCNSGYNATVTLGASGHTMGAPTNLFDGMTLGLEVVQDGTGSRTMSWNTIWDFGAAGLPTLQTGAGKADRVFGQYNARTGKIEASFRQGA